MNYLRFEVYQLRFDASELVAGFVSRDVALAFIGTWPIECVLVDIKEHVTRGDIDRTVEDAARRANQRSRRI